MPDIAAATFIFSWFVAFTILCVFTTITPPQPVLHAATKIPGTGITTTTKIPPIYVPPGHEPVTIQITINQNISGAALAHLKGMESSSLLGARGIVIH
jgi:hypothetical protein